MQGLGVEPGLTEADQVYLITVSPCSWLITLPKMATYNEQYYKLI